MNGSGACAGVTSQLGVYLTGSIAPADRATVVRHLTACEDCRGELAGLAGLPGLLRRPAAAQAIAMATEDEVPAAEDGPEPGGAGPARRRRRHARRPRDRS